MSSTSTELKLAQISKDISALAKLNDRFGDHAQEDAAHFKQINDILLRIESKLDPENKNYILGSLEARLDPIFEIHDGGVALKKLIMGVSMVVVALSALGASGYAFINWLHHG